MNIIPSHYLEYTNSDMFWNPSARHVHAHIGFGSLEAELNNEIEYLFL